MEEYIEHLEANLNLGYLTLFDGRQGWFKGIQSDGKQDFIFILLDGDTKPTRFRKHDVIL
jgi:hypothetical protein